MSKADRHPIADALIAPQPTIVADPTCTGRRKFLGGCTAGALLFGAAGAGKAAEADGELFAAIDRWHAMLAQSHAFSHDPDCGNWPEFDELIEQEDEAARHVANTPPRTPEGLQAKARFVRAYFDEYGDPHDTVQAKARCLLDDLLGGAA